MESPTPSIDSLAGINCVGSQLDQEFTSSSYTTSSDSPVTVSPTTSVISSSSIGSSVQFNTRCGLCHETFVNPKVLPCLHTYCQACLERNQEHPDKLTCPRCQQECPLTSKGISALLPDFAIRTVIDSSDEPKVFCTSCKSKTTDAVARCYDCKNFLCPNCVMAHQFMHCFEGHRVMTLSNDAVKDDSKNGLISPSEKVISCPRHKMEVLKYFCRSCNIPVCKECTLIDHPAGIHECEHLTDVGAKHVDLLNQTVQESKSKATDIRNMLKTLEHSSGRLQVQYHKAQNEINDTFQFYRSMLEERKQELLKELESVFSAKQMSLSVFGQKAQDTVDRIYQACEFYDRLTKHGSIAECLMFKKLIESKLQGLTSFNVDANIQTAYDLEFVSNYQAIQVGVRNTFGYVRSSSEVNLGPSKQPPIARPINGIHLNGNSSSINGTVTSSSTIHNSGNGNMSINTLNGVLDRPYTNGITSGNTQFESNIISKRFSTANSLGPFSTSVSDLNLNGVNSYEKWSNGGADIFQNGSSDHYPLSLSSHGDSVIDISSKLLSTSIFPPKSQIKRQKMIYHCKFGEFGVLEGQFTEPSGVAVNAQNDIIVADTNNHRIQIFDKEGRFKFQFGECGKRDGQLLYPNRVAVVKTSGDIIVTERSPTHQIQIYNQYGQFVRKFGANILQHPRGVTVDSKGRIVVVECKVMRVIIFDQSGNVLQKFGCSKHLEFPNGVVVNDKQEIFISDNRAHCVKVFNYEGVFLRQIGSEGVTNYPIGVGINSAGEILIADNHNNFNLTIFTQDGQLVSALESKVKHAQCFDVALMDDGSVVLASKDYRLYIYRYVQIPPIGL
ncbi:brain tumor protein-like [Cimex lectularius]|uniref:Brain tumor protein n=1 Tax=Cimex lectularius TaxID=79782 RepID=A0A8I6RZ69_CIMLE|nr:brain tumor protein-like [Cimex lectularius]XP_014252910.1 brain tumor protein-like [Cimex lectularius]XP_014252911.1 brain tumor protein-like [Cimex lectularius]XP_014252912.1 brain tumor protein-like [Cimex lectularius]